MEDLLGRVRQRNTRAIARLITLVENGAVAAETALAQLYKDTGRAHIVGVTGAPGSGKSTLVNQMALSLRARHHFVGIIAVDPSSPFTGGAVLGDRVRMRDLSGDDGIFIRSMASRGKLGGLAHKTASVIKVLDAAGFDTVIVETVGAGQAEVDIASAAHTTIVIEAPGMGDDIQSIKAGVLEIADILVVNKADHPGAARAVRVLKSMLQLGSTPTLRHHGKLEAVPQPGAHRDNKEAHWAVPVLQTIATEGQGIDVLVDRVLQHKAYLKSSGDWIVRERKRSQQEMDQLMMSRFQQYLLAAVSQRNRDELIAAVADREIDPQSAVAQLFEQITSQSMTTLEVQ